MQSKGLGICSFAHRSFAHFAQLKWATVSNWLRSLKTNELPWANRSGRTEEMSDCERIAQVAQDKWANGHFAQKFCLKKSKILFKYVLYTIKKKFFEKMSKSLILPNFLFFGVQPWAICSCCSEEMSDHERISQVAHQKWANEWIATFFWANHSGHSFLDKKRVIRSEIKWAISSPGRAWYT